MKFIFLFVLLLTNNLFAASITKTNGTVDELKIITIKGEIISGDESKFRTLALSTKNAIVVLDSPGGKINPALEIGKIIRLNGYATEVKNAQCTSSCALIWLAGEPRSMNNNTSIGFHSAFLKGDDGRRNPTATSNALIGAYLTKLGFSEKVILFVTTARPNEMNWLQKSTADRLGIMASFISEQEIQAARDNFASALKKTMGPTPSNEDAAKLYLLSAEAGFAGAQNNLGDLYETGDGVTKNTHFSIYWYARSAERGEPTAYLSLASILSNNLTDSVVVIESLKFATLAYATLPEGKNKLHAKELIGSLSAKLSDVEKEQAFELANSWTPLFQEKHLMSDTPRK